MPKEEVSLIARKLSSTLDVHPVRIERVLLKSRGRMIAQVNRLEKAKRIANVFLSEGVDVVVEKGSPLSHWLSKTKKTTREVVSVKPEVYKSWVETRESYLTV